MFVFGPLIALTNKTKQKKEATVHCITVIDLSLFVIENLKE